MAYVNVCVSRRLKEELAWSLEKEELAWVIDKQLWFIINTIL